MFKKDKDDIDLTEPKHILWSNFRKSSGNMELMTQNGIYDSGSLQQQRSLLNKIITMMNPKENHLNSL